MVEKSGREGSESGQGDTATAAQPTTRGVSKVERRGRHLRLPSLFYGSDYVDAHGGHSAARRLSIEKGRGTPSLPELLAGAGFYLDDAREDLTRFCSIILRRKGHLRRHFVGYGCSSRDGEPDNFGLNRLFDELNNVQGRRFQDAVRGVNDALQYVRSKVGERAFAGAFGLPEFDGRLDFYLACSHDRRAQTRIAYRCFDAVASGRAQGAELHALRCGLAWLHQPWTEFYSSVHSESLSGRAMQVAGGVILRRLMADARLKELDSRLAVAQEEKERDTKNPEANAETGTKGTDDDSTSMADVSSATAKVEAEDKPSLVVFTAVQPRDANVSSYKAMLNEPIPLVQPPDMVEARNLLLSEFPHASEIVDRFLLDVANHRDHLGRPIIRLTPTILVGDPGGGKSSFAKRFGEVMRLPQLFFACAGVSDSMFGASNKRWSNSSPALPVERISIEKVANLLVVLDEIEKTGTRADNGRLQDVILPMVEPSTAERYFDQSLSAEVNLSALNWLGTANSLVGIGPALRDRFRVLTFPTPGREHLRDLLPSVFQRLSTERYGDECWIEPLDEIEFSRIRDAWKVGSIRVLKRLVQATLDAREQHHRKMMS